jgi:hypothetical protein
MALFVLAFLIGVIAGLRTMTAPAAVSWAAHLGWLPVENTPLAFLGFAVMPYIIIVLAIGELISDQLPKTPSRKVPNKPEEMNQIAGPGPNAHNRVGSFIGPMAASFRVNPPDGPCKGDLETAEIYSDEVQKSRFNFSVEKAAKYAIADRIAGCSPR